MKKMFSLLLTFAMLAGIISFSAGGGTVYAEGTSSVAKTPLVAAGSGYSATVRKDGSVWSWGYNYYGEYGNGTTSNKSTPVLASGFSDVSAIALGYYHTVVIRGSNKAVYAWGCNEYGQLGNGAATWSPNPTPIPVPNMTGVTSVAAGFGHTAVVKGGKVYVWGRNNYGQLGNNSNVNSSTPIELTGLPEIVSVACGMYHTVALDKDGYVWTWGWNITGQLGNNSTTDSWVPIKLSGINDVKAIEAGDYHTIVIKNDKSVWAWGNNNSGQIGTTATNTTIPVKTEISGDVIDIAAGGGHSLALKSDGTVWGWGGNLFGQLGDNAKTNVAIPKQLVGVTNVMDIAAGNFHSVAIKKDGTIWATGDNPSGALGNNTTTQSIVWVQAVGLTVLEPILDAGYYHTIALKDTGTVWAWGDNQYGQLGDGTNEDKQYPITVEDLTDVIAVAAGGSHTVALKSDGTVWAWGRNNCGQLGDNSTNQDKNKPVQVYGLTGIIAISAGYYHSVALKNDGTVWSWGYNYYGQLGNGLNAISNKPVQVSGLSGVSDISAGYYFTVALKSDGTILTWGSNSNGQLGEGGVVTKSNTPIPITGLTNVFDTSAGGYHTLAAKNDGTLWTWGYNYYGQLGLGIPDDKKVPTLVPLMSNICGVDGSYLNSVVFKSDGTVWTSGYNGYGQLGNGGITGSSSFVPVDTSTGLSAAVTIAGGGYNTAAVKTDGTVWTWGRNSDGQLGTGKPDGDIANRKPAKVIFDPYSPIMVAANGYHTLALKKDGTVWGFGHNDSGQLGDGSYFNRKSSPVMANGIVNVKLVEAGMYHSMALKTNGTLWTWGDNYFGQLGDGTKIFKPNPTQVVGLPNVSNIAAGDFHSLAVDNIGKLWAWGGNDYGELGIGNTTPCATPVPVTGLPQVAVYDIAAGVHHSVALLGDGTVWTWGDNRCGQLGDGTKNPSYTPKQVQNLPYIIAVAAGRDFSIAVTFGGVIYGWGDGTSGQLGDGTQTDQLTPVPINTSTGLTQSYLVSCGHYHTVAVKYEDYTTWVWGLGSSGQLGNGNLNWEVSPAQLNGLNSISIATGHFHSVFLKDDGTVWTCGDNSAYQLGDGTNVNRPTPVLVPNFNLKEEFKLF